MSRFATLAALFLAFSLAAPLAAAEEPRAGQPKADGKAVKFDALDENSGASFGDWVVYRYGAKSTVIRNTKTDYVIYLPWSSNGWINFRDDKDEWYVFYSFGKPMTQNRDDLKVDPMFKKKPVGELAQGKYKLSGDITINGKTMTQTWEVTVGKDTIEFANSDGRNKIVVTRNKGEFTHNDRAVGK